MAAGLPVACDMRALSERERKAQMAASIRLIIQGRTSLAELANGYELCFPMVPGRLVDLARWMERESLCCPWIDFALLRPSEGTVRLRLTSDAADAKEMIAAGFALAANLSEGAQAPSDLAFPVRPLIADDFKRMAEGEASKSCGCKQLTAPLPLQVPSMRQ